MPGATGNWGEFDTGAPIEAPATEVSAIEQLRQTASRFTDEFNRLLGLESVARENPSLMPEWGATVEAAQGVRDSIQWITSTIDGISGVVGGIFGDGTLRGISRLAGHGLGIAPLAVYGLSIAAVTGATALLLRTIDSMRITSAKLEAIQAGTLSPEAAFPPDDWGNPIVQTGNAMKWILIGAAVFIVGPRLLDMLKKG